MGSLRLHGGAGFAGLREEWDELALVRPSPFHSHAWLSSWWDTYGTGEPIAAAVHGPDGALRAAALLRRTRSGGLAAAANDHSGDWGAVAIDADARATLYGAMAGLRAPTLTLASLRDDDEQAAAREALTARGRAVQLAPGNVSPFVALPDDLDALLAGRSANLRSQLGRRRRALEDAGELRLRTVGGGAQLDAAFAAFVSVEASGWKHATGTALSDDTRAASLYRRFAHAAAARGWLRLHLLELDGEVLAADLGCVMGDQAFLIKTGFAPEHAKRSPGLVLRGEVLRHLIGEGVRGYDLLGGPDAYKLRWTDDLRPRRTVRGFAGALGAGSRVYWSTARPLLAAAAHRSGGLRDRLRARGR